MAMLQDGTVIFTVGVNEGGFVHHAPKPEGIRAVKVTKDNIKTLAADLVKAGKDVNWRDKTSFDADGVTWRIDYWMIQEYDYELEVNFHRPASHSERVKYDLR